MNKHKFNIFPEMVEEEFSKLVDDINIYGYDENRPITTYEGEIIDGWNRYKACEQLGVEATYTEFNGTDKEAVLLVLRSNKRRNLSSSQWAAIAVDSEEIIQVIKEDVEAEGLKKRKENYTNQHNKEKRGSVQLIEPSQKDNNKLASSKVAEIFNTNRGYISDAQKFRDENPEIFAKIRSGELTISKAKQEKKMEKLEAKKTEYKTSLSKEIEQSPKITLMDCIEYLNTFEDNSIDAIITDPPYATDVEDISLFVRQWLPLAIRKTKKEGRMYICAGAYPKEVQAYLNVMLSQEKFTVDNPLIWSYKNTLGQTPKMKYNLNYQMIWHLYSEKSPELDTGITSHMWSVQEINAPDGRQGNRLHTWQKPDELANRLVIQGTKPDWLVVDCFACTGTFLLAAARNNRIAKGCDNNSDNLNIAKERGCQIL